MIPQPRQLDLRTGSMAITPDTRIVAGGVGLLPLARQFAHEIAVLTSLKLPVGEGAGRAGDIVLALNATLAKDVYVVDVGQMARVNGGSEQSLAHGSVTLLQALRGGLKQQPAELPCLHVEDWPAAPYRGLMVDLARQWHPFDALKMLVALCRWYKLNYLHLHLTDDQSFTFPSQAYPALATPDRHYTREQLQELEEYARVCGVTLLPELDVPGHSRALLTALPDLVACESAPGGCDICPGRESSYAVMEMLIGEMCEIFRTTPYFHIGADETGRKAWKSCPHCRERMAAEGLDGDEALYRYFIIRLNEIVRRHGKQTIVWEGFGPGGRLRVPTNVAVMVFESDYHLAPDLLTAGYAVINTTWQPLYVCGPGLCWPPGAIYRWNYLRWESPWERSPAYREPIQVQPAPAVLGAQLCSWGQADAEELPSLRERVAAMSERVWNPEQSAPADFFARLESADLKLSRFLYSAWPAEKWPFWIQRPVEKSL